MLIYWLMKKMSKTIVHRLTITVVSLVCFACSTPQARPVNPLTVECTDPRPQICTMDFTPVCATKDNRVRCVTTPCQSTETKTYSNGCSACANPAVMSYIPGECMQ